MSFKAVFTLLAFLILVTVQTANGQEVIDTPARTRGDSVQRQTAEGKSGQGKHKFFQPNPKKAGLYSSIVPGMGQVYNRQYWKVPIIYAGIGVAGYFFFRNLDNYQSYRKAYIGRINNPYPTDQYVNIYTTDQLQQLQGDYNKYLNLTVLFSTIGYALQVIDAITSAHLKNFDISRDISMRVLPVPNVNGVGLGLVVNFK